MELSRRIRDVPMRAAWRGVCEASQYCQICKKVGLKVPKGAKNARRNTTRNRIARGISSYLPISAKNRELNTICS